MSDRLNEILTRLFLHGGTQGSPYSNGKGFGNVDEARSEILDLFESLIPKVKWTGKSEDGRFYKDWCSPEDESWNACRCQMLEQIEKLRDPSSKIEREV